MDHQAIIDQLNQNKNNFHGTFNIIPKKEYLWKPSPGKWNLLEVACHLYDEEREDFRARLKHVLFHPEDPLPKINPEGWVKQRNYSEQNFEETVEKFLKERENSINWLNAIQSPKWKNEYQHPKFGTLSAEMFLANWLAHDYLHIRQVAGIRYAYLKLTSGQDLRYAGEW